MKWGGGERPISLDEIQAHRRIEVEPIKSLTADQIYERQWAMAVLDQVLARLEEDYRANTVWPNRATPFVAQFAPLPTAHWLANLSTRVEVGAGDDAVIAGFITRGGPTKRIMIRALGSSLASSGIANALADPVLELYDGTGALIATNDNWRITPTNRRSSTPACPGYRKTNQLFSCRCLPTMPASTYTAVMRGAGDTTGVGLLEVYDLDLGIGPNIQNISTRGRVNVGEDVLIGGTIVLGSNPQDVIVRALGPSLPVTEARWPIPRSSYTTRTASCCAATTIGGPIRRPKSRPPCSNLRTIRRQRLSPL